MGWEVHLEGNVRHVWPSDEKDHNLSDDVNCWCKPKSQVLEDGSILLMHSSRDGREYIERLTDKDNIGVN